ncbi:MAG: cation transporter [Firmicutes bacterium]|nr:cation transporter [Bacillota bacterium]MBR3375805.1 cation transporter [Bacillota bacterium]
MKEFIWKKIIKDHENIKDPIVRSRYTRLTGFMGIAVNTVLCIIKIIIGLTIHSIAVMADGIHDMADSLAASVTLIGANLAKKPADEDHPYGHARSEYIASLVVSGIIMFVGYELLKNSVEKCMHPVESEFSWAIVGFMVFAILLKGSSSLFIIATGKRISSLPVIAAGTDNRNDVITSILILIGMLVHHFTGFDPDGYLGIVMSLFILYSGFTLIRQTVDQLLGARPDPEMVKEMEEIIESHPVVLDAHDLVIHSYGPGRTYATFHAEVDADSDIMEVHDALDHIEREISEKLGINVTCHMDPVFADDPIRKELGRTIGRVLEGYTQVKGFHDLRIVHDEDTTKVSFDVEVVPGKDFDGAEIYGKLADAIKSMNGDLEIDINFDQAYTVTK